MLIGAIAGAATLTAGRVAKAACVLTPAQVDGPFYPVVLPQDRDWDLTQVAGATGRAEGEVIEVTGRVLDAKCRPVTGCVIEVWQANMYGRYTHPRDEPKGRPLDPNFQGYARFEVGRDGSYRLRTIIPGSYVAIGNWVRPPHIHFKVSAPFNPSLTTQMYFAGQPLNAKDLILGSLSPEQRAALEVAFDATGADGVRTGTFDLTLAEGWQPPPEMALP